MTDRIDSSGVYAFPSGLGWMALAWNRDRLSRLTFGHPSASAALASLEVDGEWTTARVQAVPSWVESLADRLQAYSAGSEEPFDDVPLDLSHFSAFQQKVVRACRRIGRGRVRTYGELAASAGAPGAARAVGTVMSKNRFPIIVPCHRVVGAGGSLGGFSARDGINLKRRMLEMEGARLQKPKRTRQTIAVAHSHMSPDSCPRPQKLSIFRY